MSKYEKFQEEYPTFIYHSYEYIEADENLSITFHFEIEGLKEFHPTLKIQKNSDYTYNRETLNNLIFHIGMIELISYWKATCSKNIIIRAGYLNQEQIDYFKDLYFHGLGEFFYLNEITPNKETFVHLKIEHTKESIPRENYNPTGNLIAIGGGKDSNVSLEILKNEKDNTCFIVNPKQTTLECAYTARYQDDQIAKVYRTIDKNLLELNELGFLNGHTPFSALLAFVSYLTAYLYHKKYIVLSNENSANQSTVINTDINHQYSKTYTFETNFIEYSNKYLKLPIHYFSLLRPLNEYQIAYLFSKYKKYHKAFKSCNLGSKKEPWSWCCNCSKCLFIFSILSPFLYKEELVDIFGEDLFEKEELLPYFKELIGLGQHKPFDCVGTIEEMNYAIQQTIQKLESKNLPCLLKYYQEQNIKKASNPLNFYNQEHKLPEKYEALLKEELVNER